jgi:cobalt-zinc-cadmium resistance protein CzcA
MAMRLDELVSGVKADVAVKIFGTDVATLERLAQEVRGRLGAVPGAADLQMEVLTGAVQLDVEVDRYRIARYGLNVAHVRELVETAIGGAVATEVLDGARRFGVLVRFPEALRNDRAAVERLLLTAPGGERVPLGRVARVAVTRGPEAVNHENAQRRIVVQANVRGRDLGGFVADAREALAPVALPPGYYVTWGGQFENQERATRRLALVIPLSVGIIFVLLFATFGRVRQALLVILNVPFALVGGVAALWLTGLNLNLSASVGFVSLFGVAVLNGVVLIAAVNNLRGQGLHLRKAVLAGAGTRLRPC